ncbi:MAG TPA: HD domain-containing protein, partial [Chloroflexia bacterium]|nr:HD domain-containing protein [Chloroflexia bacterium]
MFDEATPGVLLQAVQFAAHKHQDQRRKDQQATPYINHPIDVAATLWQVGGVRETAILVAALLHDTLEDTATTPEEIRAAFGATVLELVLEVTDDKSLPKAVRKQLQVAHAPQKSPGARAIKLADKIHNVHDVGASPPADWSPQRLRDYLDWTEQVVAGLRGT